MDNHDSKSDIGYLHIPDCNLSPKSQLKFTFCQHWLSIADQKMSSDQS